MERNCCSKKKIKITRSLAFVGASVKQMHGRPKIFHLKLVHITSFRKEFPQQPVINTTIIGNTTAGADGTVSLIMLPVDLKTVISGIGVYYPDGTKTQRIDIVPDIEMEPTIKVIQKGKDNILNKTIELINR